MKLVSEKIVVTNMGTSESENNGTKYTNYKLYYMSNGYPTSVRVTEDVFKNVEIGDEIKLDVEWFYNPKLKRVSTYVSGLHLGK